MFCFNVGMHLLSTVDLSRNINEEEVMLNTAVSG